MALTHHKSVSKFFEDAAKHVAHAKKSARVETCEDDLSNYLGTTGPINAPAFLALARLGHLHGAAAVVAYDEEDLNEVSNALQHTLCYKALDLRLQQALSATIPDKPDNRPTEFEDGLNAALPFALSRWPLAKDCARAYLWLADKDQRLRSPETRRMSNGTTDAFLVYLFSDALDLPTSYKPEDMLEDCYRALLDNWRTDDKARFQEAMAGAIDFHIRRSKPSTDHVNFEFGYLFEQVFAVELLSVMALRKRLTLPGFNANHALVDGPWEVIQRLPPAAPYPLAEALEARFKKDYATFT